MGNKLPEHVAIIMDGNRRWARKHILSIHSSYDKGAKAAEDVITTALSIGIKVLTLYFFSTENWKRPPEEINPLFSLIVQYLKKNQEKMEKKGICFHTIGKASALSPSIRETLEETKSKTRKNNMMKLVLAINYGSRDEILRGIKALAEDYKEGKIAREEITEELFSHYLDTSEIPDPDLLIRTSGEMRLSNFLLWQISYSELFVTRTLWPDFSSKDFMEAIQDYQKRERRLGTGL